MSDMIENNIPMENTPEEAPKKPKMTLKRLWKEWILPFGLEIIVLWLVVKFIFFVAIVPTGSMEPTIATHSAVFSLRIHDLDSLERGDVIVFESEELGATLVKRLIGLPGDQVSIEEDGSLTINGEPYAEDYVEYQYAIPGDYFVPDGHYLFFGDNRANSLDARYWLQTYIPAEALQGRSVFTLFPFSNFGPLN